MGLSGASLGRLVALLGGFLNLQNLAFVKHWPKMVSKKLFGSTLEGFGESSGRIWEGLGRIWTNFGMDFGKIERRFWRSVNEFEKSWGRVSK